MKNTGMPMAREGLLQHVRAACMSRRFVGTKGEADPGDRVERHQRFRSSNDAEEIRLQKTARYNYLVTRSAEVQVGNIEHVKNEAQLTVGIFGGEGVYEDQLLVE